MSEQQFLIANGRISGLQTTTKRGNNIDGARFKSYDSKTGIVVLRLDDSEVPEFWSEVKFTKKELEEFIQRQELEEFERENGEIDF